jgi:hypothetical protein
MGQGWCTASAPEQCVSATLVSLSVQVLLLGHSYTLCTASTFEGLLPSCNKGQQHGLTFSVVLLLCFGSTALLCEISLPMQTPQPDVTGCQRACLAGAAWLVLPVC